MVKSFINKNINSARRDSNGYSLVELIVVMAIIAALAVSAGSAIHSLYGARSKAAVGEISAMLSQCKVDNLSGVDSTFILKYDNDDKSYECYLSTKEDGSEKYEKHDKISADNFSQFGNSLLNIVVLPEVNNSSNLDEVTISKDEAAPNELRIKFDKNTGAVEHAEVTGVSPAYAVSTGGSSTRNARCLNIKADSIASRHSVKLYLATGSIVEE